MNVVCVGDCGIDQYLPENARHVGGITANVARHARDSFAPGDTVRIVSCLGDDAAGDQVAAAFRNSGIDCLWQRSPGATPVQYIEVQPDGERRFVRYAAGVLPALRFTDSQREAIRGSDLLIGTVFDQIVGLFERLMAVPTAALVAIDFADFLQHPDFALLERHLEQIDVAFFGLDADRPAEIERLAHLARARGRLFVVTLGAQGSRVFHGNAVYHLPVEPAVVVDTTGAGDAYAAAFLAAYCSGAGIIAAMRSAARLAAAVVAGSGAYPATGRQARDTP